MKGSVLKGSERVSPRIMTFQDGFDEYNHCGHSPNRTRRRECHISRTDPFTDQRTIREIQIEQSRMRSLIGTNEALALARKWLTEMDVDIYRLEMEHMPRVEQAFFYPDSTSISDPPQKQQRKTLLPVFHIVWGTDTTPVIRISIFGPTQELLSLQQEDTTYSKRLRVIMKDPEGLLAIRDHDFLRLSEKEKAALVQSHIIESPPATHPQKP